jgi:hypothetical protein
MRRSREQWAQIVEQFEGSGQSQEAFCTQHRLNIWSFRGWLRASPRPSLTEPFDCLRLPVKSRTRTNSVCRADPLVAQDCLIPDAILERSGIALGSRPVPLSGEESRRPDGSRFG